MLGEQAREARGWRAGHVGFGRGKRTGMDGIVLNGADGSPSPSGPTQRDQ